MTAVSDIRPAPASGAPTAAAIAEERIRPRAMFDEYLRLCEVDVGTYFGAARYLQVACVGCGATDTPFAFHKKGFDYCECRQCATLFVNPRPEASAFDAYYQDSPSVRYWATNFYKETEAVRRETIFRPRAQLLLTLLNEFGALESVGQVLDIGAGYGIFCEEARKVLPPSIDVIAIEPAKSLADVCRAKGIRVVESFIEHLKPSTLPPGDGARVLVSFELFEHVHDPGVFLRSCYDLLQPGDFFVLSTLSAGGFDIQVLWDRHKSVHPPHHVNFLNPAAFRSLLSRTGFEVLDVRTPGRLDVDILLNNIERVPDRFVHWLARSASDEAKAELQAWCSKHGFSSHMLAVVRRP